MIIIILVLIFNIIVILILKTKTIKNDEIENYEENKNKKKNYDWFEDLLRMRMSTRKIMMIMMDMIMIQDTMLLSYYHDGYIMNMQKKGKII